jgi:hypothetical protein
MGIFEAKIRAKLILISSLTVQGEMVNDYDWSISRKLLKSGCDGSVQKLYGENFTLERSRGARQPSSYDRTRTNTIEPKFRGAIH